jgi:hypothetical protein
VIASLGVLVGLVLGLTGAEPGQIQIRHFGDF